MTNDINKWLQMCALLGLLRLFQPQKLLMRRARKAGSGSAVNRRITTRVIAHVGGHYQQADSSARRPAALGSHYLPSGSETHA